MITFLKVLKSSAIPFKNESAFWSSGVSRFEYNFLRQSKFTLFNFFPGGRHFRLRNEHPLRRRSPHLVRLHRGRHVPVQGRSCRRQIASGFQIANWNSLRAH